MRLKGKSAIVTGAASGIGRAIAKKFATEGAHLVTADIDGSTAKTIAEEIRADGGTAHSIATDITKRGDVYALTDTAIDYFGKVMCSSTKRAAASSNQSWTTARTTGSACSTSI